MESILFTPICNEFGKSPSKRIDGQKSYSRQRHTVIILEVIAGDVDSAVIKIPMWLYRSSGRCNGVHLVLISVTYGESYMLKRTQIRIMLVLSLMVLMFSLTVNAQESITLSIAVPSYNESFYQDAIEAFEAQHTNVHVQIEGLDSGVPIYYFPDTAVYLDDVARYAETADVLMVNGEITTEATRAGYLLDLTPLIMTDTSLDVNDFYPSVWDAFHWDNGMWAIPISGDVIGLFYNPQAFDDAGLAYPNENWTIADFEVAIQTLAQFNADDEIVIPGLLNAGNLNYFGMLLISMLGDDVVDDSVSPNLPDFSNPNLESLMLDWGAIRNSGAMDRPQDGYNSGDLPLAIGPVLLGMGGNQANIKQPAPFPNGGIGVDPKGFAVSAGTQHPELAYELIMFLTTAPEVTGTFFSETPARRSMNQLGTDEGSSFSPQLPPELQAFVIQGMEEGISLNDIRFTHYLTEILFDPRGGAGDVQQALNDLDARWQTRLAIADERALINDVAVIPPVPAPVLSQGEINLNFTLGSLFSPLPNEGDWQIFMDEFALNDPDVGFVNFDVGFTGGVNEIVEIADCFYLPFNNIPSMDTNTIISLDPLMSADPTVDINDFLPTVLPSVQRNGLTWAFPITLQPLVMNYHVQRFADAGIPAPENGWTVADFEIALQGLDGIIADDEFVLESNGFDNAYLLNLIAAYGGLPVDTRTTPFSYNFTDPTTVNAIQQVLSLIDSGYINYSPLTDDFLGISATTNQIPIFAETLNGTNFVFGDPRIQEEYRFTTFPSGTQYSTVSYDVGGAYISANTPYIEACYRLISQMAGRPELFYTMPARESLIDVPALSQTQSQSAVDFYSTMSNLMRQPNTVSLSISSIPSGYLDMYWLNRFFDRYVAGEVVDVESALAEAEQFTLAFQECSQAVLSAQEAFSQNQYDQLLECAVRVDPTFSM